MQVRWTVSWTTGVISGETIAGYPFSQAGGIFWFVAFVGSLQYLRHRQAQFDFVRRFRQNRRRAPDRAPGEFIWNVVNNLILLRRNHGPHGHSPKRTGERCDALRSPGRCVLFNLFSSPLHILLHSFTRMKCLTHPASIFLFTHTKQS